MSESAREFSADQAAAANSALRAAIGLPPERFGAERFVGMISDEIEQLHATGKTDDDISRLLSAAGVELDADAIARFYAHPAQRRRPPG